MANVELRIDEQQKYCSNDYTVAANHALALGERAVSVRDNHGEIRTGDHNTDHNINRRQLATVSNVTANDNGTAIGSRAVSLRDNYGTINTGDNIVNTILGHDIEKRSLIFLDHVARNRDELEARIPSMPTGAETPREALNNRLDLCVDSPPNILEPEKAFNTILWGNPYGRKSAERQRAHHLTMENGAQNSTRINR